MGLALSVLCVCLLSFGLVIIVLEEVLQQRDYNGGCGS